MILQMLLLQLAAVTGTFSWEIHYGTAEEGEALALTERASKDGVVHSQLKSKFQGRLYCMKTYASGSLGMLPTTHCLTGEAFGWNLASLDQLLKPHQSPKF